MNLSISNWSPKRHFWTKQAVWTLESCERVRRLFLRKTIHMCNTNHIPHTIPWYSHRLPIIWSNIERTIWAQLQFAHSYRWSQWRTIVVLAGTHPCWDPSQRLIHTYEISYHIMSCHVMSCHTSYIIYHMSYVKCQISYIISYHIVSYPYPSPSPSPSPCHIKYHNIPYHDICPFTPNPKLPTEQPNGPHLCRRQALGVRFYAGDVAPVLACFIAIFGGGTFWKWS